MFKKKVPFTAAEWDAVRWAANSVTEAAQANDPGRRAARFSDLQGILTDLRGRHGNHPLLFETEADFTPDSRDAADLYRQAEDVAGAAEWPTMSIRLALARVLFEELGQPSAAREVLLACREELPWAVEADCHAWSALLAACPPELPADLEADLAGAGSQAGV